MIAFVIYSVFVLVCGLVLGATLLRDWLDRPRCQPESELPRPWLEHMARLNTPAVWRRKAGRL